MFSKRIIAVLLSVVALLTVLAACGYTEEAVKPVYKADFTLADLGSGVDFHTDIQNEIWNIEDLSLVVEKVSGDKELSKPLPITLNWSCECDDPDAFVDYTVSLSENEDLSNAVEFRTTKNKIDVYNLKIGTDYFWKVTANYEKSTYTSETARFSTSAQGPRNLFVDGITNVRDIGGYACEDGSVVKQGMLIRSGRLNLSGTEKFELEITPDGLKVLTDDLKIKTEVDLRLTENNENGKLTESPIPGAALVSLPMVYKEGSIMTTNDEEIRDFIALLSDEANYPILFHCNIGTDRTGLLTYIVLTLCGVDYDTIRRDYSFSNLGVIGSPRSVETIDGYEKILEKYKQSENASRADSMRAFLKTLGVTDKQLDGVINILCEKA